jgi:hypothetical protein
MQITKNIIDFTNRFGAHSSETAAGKFVKTANLYNPRVYEFFSAHSDTHTDTTTT